MIYRVFFKGYSTQDLTARDSLDVDAVVDQIFVADPTVVAVEVWDKDKMILRREF